MKDMSKKIKETKKEIKKVIVEEEDKDQVIPEHEDLPEDVQEALGIAKKRPKKRIHEVDYIAELENDEPSPFDQLLGDSIE